MSETMLPHNATPQEVALDLATARLGDVPVDIRTVMSPQACPAALLPWLAWSLSVDEWDAAWPEETKRAAIAASVSVHRRKGTRGAIRAAIDAAGYGDAEIIERFGYLFYNGNLRHNGGNANYARGASDFVNNTFWPASQASNGITVTKISTGIDQNGISFADYSVIGTATANTFIDGIYANGNSRVATLPGWSFTASVLARITSGSPPSGCGVQVNAISETAPFTFLAQTPSAVSAPMTETVISTNHIIANPAANQARCAVIVVVSSGASVNFTFRLKGLQFEIGAERTQITPYSLNYSPPDHWAEYRINLARPITIAQAAQVRRIAESVAPLRSRLKVLTYTSAQNLYNGAIIHNGNFAHGAA